MKTSEFYFDLPNELIAQSPSNRRGGSKLLVMDKKTGDLDHNIMTNFPEMVENGTLIIVNNSRVRKARLYARSDTGGKVEFLLIKRLSTYTWKTIVSKKKKQKIGKKFTFQDNIKGEISSISMSGVEITFSKEIDDRWLEQYGHIPLPPYIKREDTKEDSDRYQTVYAKTTGSIAAPTAGLHFTNKILKRLEERNIQVASVTLHVGPGTFIPIRSELVEEHTMHTEEYEISEDTAFKINLAKKEERKILAIGTTSVRTIESAWEGSIDKGSIIHGKSSTNIYIYPGYRFKVIDHMLTNFHTPDSSLILLVSAFAGKDRIKKAYAEAIKQKYNFFSYGDAMFIR